MVTHTDPDQCTAGRQRPLLLTPAAPSYRHRRRRAAVTASDADYETTSAYQAHINATDQDRWRPLSRLHHTCHPDHRHPDMNPVVTTCPHSTNIVGGQAGQCPTPTTP
ncbi:unnamed protein product [Boreogadus saida]